MECMPEGLCGYLDGLVPPRHPELMRMEAYAAEHRFPIIGPSCGWACYQIARLIGARRVFELGSGYGYSTAFFAKAVQESGGGEVFHVVWDQKLSDMARQHLAVLGFDGLIRYHVAEAVQTLRRTAGPFDLIFCDIDKQGYPAALPEIAAKLRPGGVLIVDNMLWHGKILDDNHHDPETDAIRELTRLVTTDPAWIAGILPLRDGLLVAQHR
ncbi:MAG: O-methyltransferase [Phycisphaeraceae bacterium]|nr:O-methyltransferase [Phycisphaeraceae bacterium]